MENREEFLKKLRQDVESQLMAKEEGGSKEQAFTRKVTELMKMKDETSNVAVAYDEETNKRLKPHKVNAFAISDDSSELDLFITIYKNKGHVEMLSYSEVDDAFDKLRAFYDKSVHGKYADTVSQSSEIYDCAHALVSDEEINDNLTKVRLILLTNCLYDDMDGSEISDGNRTFSREVVDLDRIMELSKSDDEPIIVDLKALGIKLQTITQETGNDTYKTYLAIMPGSLLADLYDKYKVRLMENNVRQFLQFTGKVNKKIKETIDYHPEMFLAYNNGIAATASSIKLDSTGHYIERIENLQIVNGGQTTASLYHARNDNNRLMFERIYVQMKLSVIMKDEEYKTIVSNISKCANNQNKVNDADMFANYDQMIRLEKYSRHMMVEPNNQHSVGYYWFFERAKGQYNNLMLKEGFKPDLKKKFESTYPKEHMFTKYDIAKYMCCFEDKEITIIERGKAKKTKFGPYVACYGNEKTFDYYQRFLMPKDSYEIDNVYYEDLIARAVLFMDADRRYGTRRSGGIGDLKKTVVPYSLAILNQAIKNAGYRINWYKIWKRQSISEELSDMIYSLMLEVNAYIRDNSPLDRYDEWGKKEECWEELGAKTWGLNIKRIKDDIYPVDNPPHREIIEFEDIDTGIAEHQRTIIEAIPKEIWEKIYEWADSIGAFNASQKITCKDIARKIGDGKKLSDEDIDRGIVLRDIVASENIDLLYQSSSFDEEGEEKELKAPKIFLTSRSEKVNFMTDDILRKLYEFEKEHHMLREFQDKQLHDYFTNNKDLSFNMRLALFFGLNDLQNKGYLTEIGLIQS